MRSIYKVLVVFGFNPKVFLTAIRGLSWYLKDYRLLKKKLRGNTEFEITKFFPIITEKFDEAGTMNGHYFNQDLYVAKLIHKANPIKHVDIGSRTDGFVAHLAVFREVEVFDIRNIESTVENISFTRADLSSPTFDKINYTDSLSCLHAIEHFGLGRYGDMIDPDGHVLALSNMWGVLKSGGRFYLSTPIGPQRIEFNAHRVFSVRYLMDLFESKFDIVSFSYIDDKGNLNINQDLNNSKHVAENFGCEYGCGIFEMIKK